MGDIVSSGKVVNLGKVRKQRNRAQARQEATENRALFGRTKAEKQSDARRKQELNKHLDQHRIDDESKR